MKKILSILTALMIVGSSATAVSACTSNAEKNVLDYLIKNKKISKDKESSGFYKVNLPNNTFNIAKPISVGVNNENTFIDQIMTNAYTSLMNFFGADDKNWAYSSYLAGGGLALAPVNNGFWSQYLAAQTKQPSTKQNIYEWWNSLTQPVKKNLLFTKPDTITVIANYLYGFTKEDAGKYNNGFILSSAAPYVGPEIYSQVAKEFKAWQGSAQKTQTFPITWGSVVAYLYFNIYISDNSKSQVYIPIDFSTTKLTFTLTKP